jgi:hypothetical protein
LTAEPTPTHLVVHGHDTPLSVASRLVLGLGEGVVAHVVPFHFWTNVCIWPPVLTREPTATQFVVVGHDTPAS